MYKLISCVCFTILLSDSFNMQLLSHMEFGVESSDITGFSQDGREFAVIGLTGDDCAAFVDVTDPVNPFEVARIPGLPSTWRDLKYWDRHVYIGTEADEGIKVVDVSDLDNPNWIYTIEDVADSHNIHIYDGYLYIVGSDATIIEERHDIWIYSLSNPAIPEFIGSWDSDAITGSDYIHDLEVYNDKIYGTAIFSSTVYIIDVSDKSNPYTLVSWVYPGMAHDCAVTEDENYLVTADEMEGGYIRIWDISDYNNITELDYFITNPLHSVHNVYIKDGLLYASWYADGVRVFDISDPNNISEIAYYDTSEVEGLYVGNWGIYVYLPSGNIIASDIETGLYVIKLGGISVQHDNIDDVSLDDSPYVVFVADVSTFNSEIEEVSLNYSLDGVYWQQTTMSSNGLDSSYSSTMTFDDFNVLVRYYISATDQDGNYVASPMDYEENPYFFIYGDLDYIALHDFESDNGWSVGDDTAVAGIWERAIPNGTQYQGAQVQPDQDNTVNGEYCFVTGNGVGDGVGFDDVDGGQTSIFSPSFNLEDYDSVLLTYFKWFTNNISDNPSTDRFQVEVSNDGGENWVFLENTNLSNNSWERHRFILSDYIALTNDVVFKVTTEDVFYEGDFGSGGSLVEAAFDDFSLQLIDFSYSLGDVNADSLFNVLDVVLAVNFALNLQSPSNFEFEASDINEDNVLDVLDIVLLVNLILDN